jgi:hypothetical protein
MAARLVLPALLLLPCEAARSLDLVGRDGRLYANGEELKIKVRLGHPLAQRRVAAT